MSVDDRIERIRNMWSEYEEIPATLDRSLEQLICTVRADTEAKVRAEIAGEMVALAKKWTAYIYPAMIDDRLTGIQQARQMCYADIQQLA